MFEDKEEKAKLTITSDKLGKNDVRTKTTVGLVIRKKCFACFVKSEARQYGDDLINVKKQHASAIAAAVAGIIFKDKIFISDCFSNMKIKGAFEHFENLTSPNKSAAGNGDQIRIKENEIGTYINELNEQYEKQTPSKFGKTPKTDLYNNLSEHMEKRIENHIVRRSGYNNTNGLPGTHAEVRAVNQVINMLYEEVKDASELEIAIKNIVFATFKLVVKSGSKGKRICSTDCCPDGLDPETKKIDIKPPFCFEACGNCAPILEDIKIMTTIRSPDLHSRFCCDMIPKECQCSKYDGRFL